MSEETMVTLLVWTFIIGAIVIGIIIAYGMKLAKKKEYNYIRNKVARMGVLTNYTYSYIVGVIGNPNGRQAIDGGMCCTWTECEKSGFDGSVVGYYTIVLLFDNAGNCVGISSETYV